MATEEMPLINHCHHDFFVNTRYFLSPLWLWQGLLLVAAERWNGLRQARRHLVLALREFSVGTVPDIGCCWPWTGQPTNKPMIALRGGESGFASL